MSYYLNKLRKALDKLIWGWMLCFLVIISHVWHVRCCSCNSCLSLILFACLLKLAHDLHAYGCSVVTLCLSCLLFLMYCLLYLCAFIHMHYCTSFRYDRWTTWRTWYWNRTRRRCLVDISRRGKEPGVHTWTGILAKRVSSNKHWPSVIPRQAPVHILLFQFMKSIYVSITCALGLGIIWNSSCMIPRFPVVILVCIGR